MSETPAKQEHNRDEKGRFQKGKSGNPHGRPPSGTSLSDYFEAALEEAHATGLPHGQVIAQQMVKKAAEGDLQAMMYIFNRKLGLPTATVLQGITPEQQDQFREIAKALRGNG